LKTTVRLAFALGALLLAARALAATTSASFQVTSTVQKTCQLQLVNNLTFVNYDTMAPSATTATTTFQFRCNKNTAYQIAIDNGSNYGLGAVATDRAMKGNVTTTAFLSYELYRDAGYTLPWGSTLGTNTLNGSAANSSWTTTTIYGSIPPGQDVISQSYTDATVTITVNY
jgi:spore coat protein U-like protein